MTPDLAIATVQVIGNAKLPGRCGLIKWCYASSALARAPFLAGRAEVIVVTNRPDLVREECTSPGVRMVPIAPDLERAVAGWSASRQQTHNKTLHPNATSRNKGLQPHGFSMATLIKWQLVGLTEYKAVFFTDVDVAAVLLAASPSAALPVYAGPVSSKDQ